jgi:NAD(P)H-flavin reductase
MAAGTTPNIIYEKEHPGTFAVDRKRRSFQPHRLVEKDGKPVLEPAAGTLADPGFFTSYEKDGRYITYFGDNHPVYAGSVVKAMASAKDGVPHIAKLFAGETSKLRPEDATARERSWDALVRGLDDGLIARVVEVIRLTPTVVEVIVRAPLQARGFHPGQFYRLQNYETNARLIEGTRLQMEGIALTGAWVDRKKGLLSLIVLEMGASSRLCALLEPGEEVVVMGPTGTPTEIPGGELVILCGGGLGNAVLFSVAHALRAAGSKVVYFAGYKKPEDLFHRGEIEAGCDQVIWSVDIGPPIPPGRSQDLTFTGNIVEAMRTYAEGRLGGPPLFDLRKAKRLISIGSDRMMAAVTRARKGVLAPHLDPGHVAVSSINSPMQCMMKEICGQCLQRHLDPATGEPTSYVFSCFNQDQPSDCVDWTNLNERLRMNTLEEKLANLWLTRMLSRSDASPEPRVARARS